jgi:enoyl-CoA hydratase
MARPWARARSRSWGSRTISDLMRVEIGAKTMTASYETIELQTDGPISIIRLNRPRRLNAINKEMLDELQRALDTVEEDRGIRALVIIGSGGNFSSGFDLHEQMTRQPVGVGPWHEILDRDFRTIMRFWHLSKPTIAAVGGYCLAGGCELALACDITMAADDAIFGEPELKFGAGIVVMLLPWLVGPKLAKELILTGMDRISAQEAWRMGMINRIEPAAELEAAALKLARHIAAIDPMLVKRTKRAINRTFEIMGMMEALESALDIDLAIEGEGSVDKLRFMEIARRDGLKAAFAWRDARFS